MISTAPSRQFQAASDGSETSVAYYADVTVSVERAWGWTGDTAHFEMFFPTARGYAAFLGAAIPTERAVFFLRNKEVAALAAGWPPQLAAEERGFNMLVNMSEGYLREAGSSVVPPVGTDGSFSSQVAGLSLDQVVALVAQARR